MSVVASKRAWPPGAKPAPSRSDTAISKLSRAPFLVAACACSTLATAIFRCKSRTKKPFWLRTSTRPLATNWSYAATTVCGLTPCCVAHWRTLGRRVPLASSRLRMRSAKRCASCSVRLKDNARINIAGSAGGLVSIYLYPHTHQYSICNCHAVLYWLCTAGYCTLENMKMLHSL